MRIEIIQRGTKLLVLHTIQSKGACVTKIVILQDNGTHDI